MKHLLILLALFLSGFFIFENFIQADPVSQPACSTATIQRTFTASITAHQADFFPASYTIPEKEDPFSLESYINSERTSYTSFSFKEAFDRYHKTQSQLFEDAIKQTLQSFNDQKTSAENKSTPPKTVWNAALNNTSAHPIVSLYAQKFIAGDPNLPSVTPTVPTLIVGFEGALNYMIFSCSFDKDNLKEDGFISQTSIQSIFTEKKKEEDQLAEKLLQAKRILDYALSSYDALAVAYPQHIQYLALIEELKKLREQFGALEEMTSKCILPNHFNASCKK